LPEAKIKPNALQKHNTVMPDSHHAESSQSREPIGLMPAAAVDHWSFSKQSCLKAVSK